MFLDNLLLPFNIRNLFEDNAISIPVRQISESQLFPPLRNITTFLSARSDLSLFYTFVLKYPDTLLNAISAFTDPLHVFAPTNAAFIDFLLGIIPDRLLASVFPGGKESVLEDEDKLVDKLDILIDLWKSLTRFRVPGLDDIIRYHIVKSDHTYLELQGLGEQTTLAGDGINISDAGIEDLDPQRGNANVVAPFVTTKGFVTIIDSLLLQMDSLILKDMILDIADGKNPSPLPTKPPKPSSSRPPSPTAPSAAPPPPIDMPTIQPEAGGEAACFPADAAVHTLQSVVQMRDLEAGQRILHPKGHSNIFLFTHRQPDSYHKFLRITTDSQHVVTLTPAHYLYCNNRLQSARSVREGDLLDTISGPARVRKVEMVVRKGLYAPHTMSGDMYVDGVRVSAYSMAVHPTLAHALLAPVRLFVKVTGVREPLGSLFYQGAGAVANVILGGADRY